MLYQWLQHPESFNLLEAVIVLVALMIVIAIHEFSHALASYSLGDHTAEHEGRLTLNPLSHLDIVGSLMLLFVGFGWGKPVPFNPYNLRWRKWGSAAVALAGPVSNFVTAAIFTFILRLVVGHVSDTSYLITFLIFLIIYSLLLGVFNLLPIPPLDGSKILLTLLPVKYEYIGIWLQKNGFLTLIILLIVLDLAQIPLFAIVVNFILIQVLGLPAILG
jgi:Zn-dependent protease